jgi:hypothetical protein
MFRHYFIVRTPFRLFAPIVILAISCIEPYNVPVSDRTLNVLVVDGFINATAQVATVKLSYTQLLDDPNPAKKEKGADVTIEASTGTVYNLAEKEEGTYEVSEAAFDKSAHYTLHITTANGMAYQSDTIRIQATLPIDSLYFDVDADFENLAIRVDTGDGSSRTGYYAWNYTETYEYHSQYYSGYKFVNHQAIPRTPDENVNTCWQTLEFDGISIESTQRLSHNVIFRYPIIFIPKGSPKISVRYSILLKQRAISAAEYQYLQLLKKNIEDVGGIFSVTPGEVLGNVRSAANAGDPVLGFFSGSEVIEKRFFITQSEIPKQLQVPAVTLGCFQETTCHVSCPPPQSGAQSCVCMENVNVTNIITSAVFDSRGSITNFNYTSPECADCRARGGITVKPDFW